MLQKSMDMGYILLKFKSYLVLDCKTNMVLAQVRTTTQEFDLYWCSSTI